MTVAVAVVAAATSTGTQDITTTDLGGNTPKAVIFLYSRSASDGTINDHAGFSMGMTDGTDHIAVAAYKRDGLTAWSATTGQAKVAKTDKCITSLYFDGSAIAVHSEAEFDSFIANGVRVDWTTASADGWLITALFFEGSDWTVAAGTADLAVSPGTTVSVGFEPDVVFLLGTCDTLPGTIVTNEWHTTFGFTTFKDSITEGRQLTLYGVTNTNQNITWNDQHSGAGQWQLGIFNVYSVDVSRASTSFTVSTDVSPSTDKIGYLAMKYAGSGQLSAGTIRLAESTGNQAFTGFGGEADQFAMFLLAQHRAVNGIDFRFGVSAHSETKSGGFAVGSKTEATTISASNPTDHHSTAFVDKIRTLSSSGTENSRCTLASFDADGITLNFTDAPNFDSVNAQWEWLYLTIVGASASTSRKQAWIID